MERLSKAECNQEQTGSCRGCPVYERPGYVDPLLWRDAQEAAWKGMEERKGIVSELVAMELSDRLSKKYCPEGNRREVTWTPLNF